MSSTPGWTGSSASRAAGAAGTQKLRASNVPLPTSPPSSTSSLAGMYLGTVCDLIYPCFFRINSDFFSFNKDLMFLSILEIIVLNGHSGKTDCVIFKDITLTFMHKNAVC